MLSDGTPTNLTFRATALPLALLLAGLISWVVAAPAMLVGTNLHATCWGSDPFTSGYTNVSGDNPWKPGLVGELQPYHFLRMMDLNHTNGHYVADGFEVTDGFSVNDPSWAGRKQKSDPNQALVAYEWQIDLCNRAKCDIWINIPYKSDDNYCHQLAQLLDDQLDPTLRIYIEWANETWNSMFPVNSYCTERGTALGLLPSHPERAGWAYHTYAAVRAFEQFENVFGKNSPRLIKILASWVDNPAWGGTLLAALDDPVVNPNGITVNALAVATYIGNTNSEVDDAASAWSRYRKIADSRGLQLLAYEGGEEDRGGPNAPGLYDLYEHYLSKLEEVGFNGLAHYYNSGGEPWAAIPNTGVGYDAAMQYPKYQALTEYAALVPKGTTPIVFHGANGVHNPAASLNTSPAIAVDFLGRWVVNEFNRSSGFIRPLQTSARTRNGRSFTIRIVQ